PPVATLDAFRKAAASVKARREGMFIPISAPSGTGKTTLGNSFSTFLPTDFAPTITSSATSIDYDSLNQAIIKARQRLGANDQRIIPINIDHRESDAPSSSELAVIKRFLRAPSAGSNCLVIWPSTNNQIAQKMGSEFEEIAGESVVRL